MHLPVGDKKGMLVTSEPATAQCLMCVVIPSFLIAQFQIFPVVDPALQYSAFGRNDATGV